MRFRSSYIILVLNVDAVLIIGSDTYKINGLKMLLSREFKVMNQGAAKMKKIFRMVN